MGGMATRTISNGGGNWNSTSTWVEGAVPTSTSQVVATGTSGNVTINVAASCDNINLTGYTGTITHNAGSTLTWTSRSKVGGDSLLGSNGGQAGVVIITAPLGTRGSSS